jgi:ribokinase
MASARGGGGDIVVVGSANSDVVLGVDRLPLPGETLAGTGLETCAGGKGANQAAAAARLLAAGDGAKQRSRFVALFGDDANGAALRSALAGDEATGVDLSLSRTLTDGTPTGTALILLLPSGENIIVIVGGANQSDPGWEAVLGRPRGGSGDGGGAGAASTAAARLLSGGSATASPVSALLLQREVPDWVNTRAAELARQGGTGGAVVLDAGGAEGPLPERLLSAVTVLSPNETELARLVAADDDEGLGPPPASSSPAGADDGLLSAETRAWVERAARLLLARLVAAAPSDGSDARPRAVLIKLGAAGSALFSSSSEEEALWQPALRPEGAVIDTTGAGDCFTAAFSVARFAEGKSAEEALLFASAAACLCVQRRGAQPSMPRREEVDALLLRSSGASGDGGAGGGGDSLASK